MYAVETEKLQKSFGTVKAVDQLDLKVPEGSIYGFLGPNGAGKTTTIKMLTGLIKPDSGIMKICGKEFNMETNRHFIYTGYLPDVPNFYDWMTAREFLKMCGELFGINKKTLYKRIEHLLEATGLYDVKKKIGGYSRGMKQRLGIAQALINDPKVVFLDEPVSALDPIGRKEVMDIIAGLSGKTTVFFSTHILADVERICDRIVILNKGKVVLEDSIAGIKNKYKSREVVLGIEDLPYKDFLNNNQKTEQQIIKSIEQHSAKRVLAEELSRQKWVSGIKENGNGSDLVIKTNDLAKAQMEIPAILAQKNIALRKFAVMEPNLEDIFIEVIKQ